MPRRATLRHAVLCCAAVLCWGTPCLQRPALLPRPASPPPPMRRAPCGVQITKLEVGFVSSGMSSTLAMDLILLTYPGNDQTKVGAERLVGWLVGALVR